MHLLLLLFHFNLHCIFILLTILLVDGGIRVGVTETIGKCAKASFLGKVKCIGVAPLGLINNDETFRKVSTFSLNKG